MKVLCVGGGSGGHITPVAAIIADIKKKQLNTEIRFVTDRRFFTYAKKQMQPLGVPVSKVLAGKLRRYANLKWYHHFKHFFISYIPNFIDIFKFAIGLVQSLGKIIAFRPDVVFAKGGYVSLPVGLAAAFFKIPLILHDSDSAPGLTNRILNKFASKIGLGMPQNNNFYSKAKSEYVGIPIDKHYKKLAFREQELLKEKYLRDSSLPVILATGGSQGSTAINEIILKIFPDIKNKAKMLLITGSDNYEFVKNIINNDKRKYLGLQIFPMLSGDKWFDIMNLSDIVVTRAGATTVAELAAGQKATIIIPSPYLASDHQTKNAELLKNSEATIMIKQADLDSDFLPNLKTLLDDQSIREKLGKNLYQFAPDHAAEKMANIIIGVSNDAKK